MGFFFSCLFFSIFSFSFSFSISFHVFFFFFYFFHFLFLYFPFVFLFFSKKKVSFLGCSKICGGAPGFLGKSAHSELALFALYLLVVTFPCGIVHILVMVRLRVVYGGRREGQVLPSYQNRQISALDETTDAPQSSLSPLLSSPSSFPSPLPPTPSPPPPPGVSLKRDFFCVAHPCKP